MSAPSAPPRSRTPLIIGIVAGIACLGLILVLVVAVALGGVALWNSSQEPDPAPAPATASDEPSATAPGEPSATSSGGLTAPPGVDAEQPYLELSSSDDGPTVDVHLDFLCPHCAVFDSAQGEDLERLAADEEITLRVRPRPMLDGSSMPEGYSGRAANAAVCVYAEDPAQWFPAETALFENQPGTEGLSDEELSTVIADATGLDVSSCITEGIYLPWIQDVVEPAALAESQGTPAVFIDDEQFTGDLSAPGTLAEALEAA